MQVYSRLYYKMSEINLVIYLIIALFFIFLAVKGVFENRHKIKNNFCVICASISLTWLVLLSLYLLNLFDNVLVISLLMGMSLTGIYYLAERKIGKINKKFKIFRLPFILTLIIIAYYILTLENIFNTAYANPSELPDYAFTKPDIKEAYMFAKTNYQDLNGLPCNCGCGTLEGAEAHGSRVHELGLADCFMDEDVNEGGKWDSHASSCGLCYEDALFAKKLYSEGNSKEEVKSKLEEKYADLKFSEERVY